MKTAVIYARYSSDTQTEQSIEGQLRVCQEYAQRNQIIIVDTYIDRAMTDCVKWDASASSFCVSPNSLRFSTKESMIFAHCSGTDNASDGNTLLIKCFRSNVDVAIVPYRNTIVNIYPFEYIYIRKRRKFRHSSSPPLHSSHLCYNIFFSPSSIANMLFYCMCHAPCFNHKLSSLFDFETYFFNIIGKKNQNTHYNTCVPNRTSSKIVPKVCLKRPVTSDFGVPKQTKVRIGINQKK